MAFIFSKDTKDDVSIGRRGRAMVAHRVDESKLYQGDVRQSQLDRTAEAFQQQENPLFNSKNDRMQAYGTAHEEKASSGLAGGVAVNVHQQANLMRRGNGNILNPSPLSWEESRPKPRLHDPLPDDYLKRLANKDENYKNNAIEQMAKAGSSFDKGFSSQGEHKAHGTKMIKTQPLNEGGLGIWGFSGLGACSKEYTNSRRGRVILEPIEGASVEGNGPMLIDKRKSHGVVQPSETGYSAGKGKMQAPQTKRTAGYRASDATPWASHEADTGHMDHVRKTRQRFPDKYVTEVSNCFKSGDSEAWRRERLPDYRGVKDDSPVCGLTTRDEMKRANRVHKIRSTEAPKDNLCFPGNGTKFADRSETSYGGAYQCGGGPGGIAAPRAHTSML